MHARDQSSSSAAFSSERKTRCNWSKTPACCQRSRRHQQVCPKPNPSFRGSNWHAMSWCRTYRMPCRDNRSGTGFGPGDCLSQGGSSGSITAHKPSSTIRGRVVTPTRTIRSSQIATPDQDRSARFCYELVGRFTTTWIVGNKSRWTAAGEHRTDGYPSRGFATAMRGVDPRRQGFGQLFAERRCCVRAS